MENSTTYTQGETALAVDGQGICFYYGRRKKVPVLNGVTISVTRSAIYSLLGPSGCGKTTLLKCIVGQHKAQEGLLRVYGKVPGSKGFCIPGRGVGYMPQDLSLYLEMSVEEILTYFGSLYGMDMRSVKERIVFLVDLLDLPDKKTLIKHLSGGQQRRVSFAVALIHKPPLLILDEPTVGVDPLLRKAIWNHLVTLAKNEHLTIIITTHYTEEARQAHTVALMRNGCVLVEKNPEHLIQHFGVFSLEDVFLKLCQKDSNEDEDLEIEPDLTTNSICMTSDVVWKKNGIDEQDTNAVKFVNVCNARFNERNNDQANTDSLLSVPCFPKEFNHVRSKSPIAESLMRLLCLTRKNFQRLKRNISFLLFTVFAFAIQIATFWLCFGSDPFDLQVAVTNEDDDPNEFGKKFLHSINNKTIHQKHFDDLTSSHESLKNGESWAVIHIGQEFSNCLVDRMLEGIDASNDTLQCSLIEVLIDMSNHILAGTIQNSLFKGYQQFASDLLGKFKKNPLLAELPLKIEKSPYGSKPATFAEFGTAALIIGVSYIVSISLSQMSMIIERKQGLLDRALVADACHWL